LVAGRVEWGTAKKEEKEEKEEKGEKGEGSDSIQTRIPGSVNC